MKATFAVLALIIVLVIFGCAKKRSFSNTENTQILAVFSSQGKLYVIDSKSEYEFSPEALSKFHHLKDFIEQNKDSIKRAEALLVADFDLLARDL